MIFRIQSRKLGFWKTGEAIVACSWWKNYFHQEQERERPVEEIAVFANDLDLIFEFEKNMRHIKLMVVMMNIDDGD